MVRSALVAAGILVGLALPARAQHVLLSVHGAGTGELLGRAVDSIGDVNGDGFPDVIAGAPSASPNQPQSGYVVVIDGITGQILWNIPGAQNGSVLGTSVAAAGDVDLDGVPDFVVGSPLVLPPLPFGPPNPPGKAIVYSGANASVIHTFASAALADGFGRSVDGGSDVNQDGWPDIVVGCDSGNFARVFSGANGAVLYTFNGDVAFDFFGYAVAMAGDADGDGFGDVAVGARLNDANGADAGMVRLFSGATGLALHTFLGDSAGDGLGYSVAGAGDVDQDGNDDLIAGARFDDDGGADAGSARVWSGLGGAALYTFHGEAAGDGAGNTNGVDGGGDVDGDGVPDLIVASALNDAHGTSSGRVRAYSGADGSSIGAADGEMADIILGVAARGGLDYNGDGLADVVIGAFGDDSIAGANSGEVRVVAMCPDAAWSNYGAGWPGTLGVPGIASIGNPVVGQSFAIQIDNSRGVVTNSLMLAGVAPAAIPTSLGGTLLLSPIPALTFSVPLPATSAFLGVTLPNDGTLCGVSVYVQVLEVDPGASKGVSFTRGLKLDFGL